MTEKQWKGAIFDLDGTLLDSMGVWDQVDIDFLKKRNLPMPDDYKQKIAAMGFPEAARYTIERFGFSETPEMLLQEWREMAREAYALHVDLKPGAKDYLEKLKSQGIPIAAATSGDRELFIPCLKHNDIYEYFDAIVTVSEVKEEKDFRTSTSGRQNSSAWHRQSAWSLRILRRESKALWTAVFRRWAFWMTAQRRSGRASEKWQPARFGTSRSFCKTGFYMDFT